MLMKIGILKEPHPETRVSLLPEHLALLKKWNVSVWVEKGAGEKAFATDALYAEAGGHIADRNEVLHTADLLLSIHVPDNESVLPGKIWMGMFFPLWDTSVLERFIDKSKAVFSMDMLPRTTRAQSMDILSSQANIAGYKAVLTAAEMYPRYMPMFMTAAGTIAPAKVLILGAGVAGLQAIATAKRLGAVVEVFDTRPAVKEEVMSLGAKFVEVEGAADASAAGGYAVEQSDAFKQKQRERIAESVVKSDIVITTAQIPGKKAPLLITEDMIEKLRSGSVIIDLAASTGGNTPFTKNNETVVHKGVTIVGNSSLQSTLPADASKLYGKNILNFLQLVITGEGAFSLNMEDDLVKGTCVIADGKIVHERLV